MLTGMNVYIKFQLTGQRRHHFCSLMLMMACAACDTSDAATDVMAAVDTSRYRDTGSGGDVTEAFPVDAGGGRQPDGGALDSLASDIPDRVCRPGTRWSAGVTAFKDISLEAGLRDMKINGIRLSAADINGDGLPELVVRNHSPGNRDDFSEGGARRTFLLLNEGGMKFSDITQASGFTTARDGGEGRTTMIVIFGDVDNDGDLDIFSGVNSADPAKDTGDRSEVLLNDGIGGFTLAAGGDIRHPNTNMPTSAAAFLDFDLDGYLDLWVGYDVSGQAVQPDRLYKGDGTGAFTDWSAVAGITTVDWTTLEVLNEGRGHRRSWGVTSCDVNNDGVPDLLSSSYGRYFNGLWLSDGAGNYIDSALSSGVGADQRVDWSTNLNAQCYCSLAPAADGCADVPGPPDYFPCSSASSLRWNHSQDRELFRLGGNTFTTACGDLDNDGDLDLVNFEIVHWDVGDTSDPTEILINDGFGRFERPGADATGMTRSFESVAWDAGDMTGGIFDFDNDGRADIYVGSSDYPGTRGILYHQESDGRFQQVPIEYGIDHARSHGLAIADFDGDGDLDVAVGHSRGRCSGDPSCLPSLEVHLFENVLGQDGNAVQIQLEGGPGTNRSAVGAKVTVTAGGITQTQEVSGGYGHYGMQNDTVLHFGLGTACDVDSVEVRWPNSQLPIDTYTEIRANYRVVLRQGAADVSYEPFNPASR